MFFPRLRNQAKWAFVFLILVFGGGFVFLGVGSGGLDLGQLLRDAFGNKGPSTGSVSKAQEQVRERPFNAIARKNLATVLERKGRIDESITAWNEYVRLRPRDINALRHLGQLELGQAERYFREAQLAAVAQQQANAGASFGISGSGSFGEALGQDPIATAVTAKLSTQFQQASASYQTAANRAVATFTKVVQRQPNNQESLFALAQAADTLQQPAVAIRAYKRLLELNVDPSTKAQIRERIRTLRQASQAGG